MSTPTPQIGPWRDSQGHRNGARVRLVVVEGVRYQQWNDKNGKLIKMDPEFDSESDSEAESEDEIPLDQDVPRSALRQQSRNTGRRAKDTYDAVTANPPISDQPLSGRHFDLNLSAKGDTGQRRRDVTTAGEKIEKTRHTDSAGPRRQDVSSEARDKPYGRASDPQKPELNIRSSSTNVSEFRISLEKRGFDFVQIPRGNFSACREFMLGHPKAADLDSKAFLQEASKALNAGQTTTAESCVEKAVLINECSDLTPKGMQEFLDDLVNKTSAQQKFEVAYMNAFQKVRQFTAAQSSSQAVVAPDARRLPRQQYASKDGGSVLFPNSSAPRDRDHRPSLSDPASLPSGMSSMYISTSTRKRHDSATQELGRRFTTGNEPPVYQSGRTHQDQATGLQPETYQPSQPYEAPKSHMNVPSDRPGLYQIRRDHNDRTMTNRQHESDTRGQGVGVQPAVYHPSRTHEGPETGMNVSGGRTGEYPVQRNHKDRITTEPKDEPDTRGQPSIPSANGIYEIRGTPGDEERLDPRYKKRGDAKTFFVEGRVFAMLWHSNAGISKKSGASNKEKGRVKGAFGEELYGHIRRFVVVRQRHGYCWCLGINSYGGQGVAKGGFDETDRKAHTIIYDSRLQPVKKSNEKGMNKEPIAVNIASGQTLNEMSRLNFGQPHTVEWNVKVLNVGEVHDKSRPYLTAYWKNEMNAKGVN